MNIVKNQQHHHVIIQVKMKDYIKDKDKDDQDRVQDMEVKIIDVEAEIRIKKKIVEDMDLKEQNIHMNGAFYTVCNCYVLTMLCVQMLLFYVHRKSMDYG